MLIEPFAFQNSKQDEAVKLVLKNKSSRSFQQSFSAETVPYIVHGLLTMVFGSKRCHDPFIACFLKLFLNETVA